MKAVNSRPGQGCGSLLLDGGVEVSPVGLALRALLPVLSAVLVMASPPPCTPSLPRRYPASARRSRRSDSYPAALRILIRDSEHRWDPGRSLCFMCSAVRPSRLQPPNLPRDRFDTLPLSVAGFRVIPVRASPFPSRLAARSGRIEFTFVTGWSFTSGCFPPLSREDAVTIGYRPESACLKRTCTPLTKHTRRRTGACFAGESGPFPDMLRDASSFRDASQWTEDAQDQIFAVVASR